MEITSLWQYNDDLMVAAVNNRDVVWGRRVGDDGVSDAYFLLSLSLYFSSNDAYAHNSDQK